MHDICAIHISMQKSVLGGPKLIQFVVKWLGLSVTVRVHLSRSNLSPKVKCSPALK